MLNSDEIEILKKAEEINKKKRKFDKQIKDEQFEKEKYDMYKQELENLCKLKQKCLDKIKNVNKYLEKCKINYIEKNKTEIQNIENKIRNMGEYTGQCLHKKTIKRRKQDFHSYDGYYDYTVCATCGIEL